MPSKLPLNQSVEIHSILTWLTARHYFIALYMDAHGAWYKIKVFEMDGACNMHGDMGSAYDIYSKYLKGRKYLKRIFIVIDWRIILNLMLTPEVPPLIRIMQCQHFRLSCLILFILNNV
jgi:hypothetical protein